MNNICVITGTRAEYGLLRGVMRGIDESERLALSLAVTGMHLSPEFGMTVGAIEDDGFRIDARVEMLLSSDSGAGMAKSVGVGVLGLADAYSRIGPDAVLVLGDRFEILAAAEAAYLMGIPVAHIAGGDTTEGAIDEGIRHAVTKMSWLHFVAAESHRRRVIQLGEDPERVFLVGSTGLDDISRERLPSRDELEAGLGFPLRSPLFLVTYHPATLGEPVSSFRQLLAALDRFPAASVVFTCPNSDASGRAIFPMLEEYAGRSGGRARVFTSLGRRRYLGVMALSDAVLGNSSSGLFEAPSLGVPTVNVGDRQSGRLRAESVIDVPPAADAIEAALRRAMTPEFRETAARAVNPYGTGGAAAKIVKVLEKADFARPRKKFYDIGFMEKQP